MSCGSNIHAETPRKKNEPLNNNKITTGNNDGRRNNNNDDDDATESQGFGKFSKIPCMSIFFLRQVK